MTSTRKSSTSTTTVAGEVAPGVPADGTARYNQGKVEWAAVKSARARKVKRPPTPCLDWMEAHPTATLSKAQRKGQARTPRVAQTFYKNGRPMNASNNSLSSLAYQGTAGIRRDAKRIPTADLVALLAKAGIKDPTTTSWDVELPNGVLMSARLEGDSKAVPQPKAPAAPKAKAATKGTRAKRAS